MLVLVIFATEPNFWIILFLVIACAITMFTPLKFIHPVRTERWRFLSLPIALIWTATATYAAWSNFDQSAIVTVPLTITSIYLLGAGIVQELIPQKSKA
jgi:phosphatidylcholine synthase